MVRRAEVGWGLEELRAPITAEKILRGLGIELEQRGEHANCTVTVNKVSQ